MWELSTLLLWLQFVFSKEKPELVFSSSRFHPPSFRCLHPSAVMPFSSSSTDLYPIWGRRVWVPPWLPGSRSLRPLRCSVLNYASPIQVELLQTWPGCPCQSPTTFRSYQVAIEAEEFELEPLLPLIWSKLLASFRVDLVAVSMRKRVQSHNFLSCHLPLGRYEHPSLPILFSP